MQKFKQGVLIVVAVIGFGVLMALREEISSTLARAVVAGTAFALLALALVARRKKTQ